MAGKLVQSAWSAVGVATGLAASAAPATPPAVTHTSATESPKVEGALTVDNVVLVMRHGVRPPTKANVLPAGMASQAWPRWAVQPGWLTAHGAQAIARLGRSDATAFRKDGVIPVHGCPAPGAVNMVADSDQRTIATGAAWLRAAFPGCAIKADHLAQSVKDPRFSPLGTLAKLDPEAVNAAIGEAIARQSGSGNKALDARTGMKALETRYAPLFYRLDAILCGTHHPAHPNGETCGVGRKASALHLAGAQDKPKLTGALGYASTAAQTFLLEYADGKPMREVGWGRASVRDIADLSAFHALKFALLKRPRPIAAANFTGLAPIVRQGLSGPARLTVIFGHDGDVASLGGLLDVHWQVPGLARDDIIPGGGVVIEAVHDKTGARFIRVSYRAQTLAQVRSAHAPGRLYRRWLAPAQCHVAGHPGLCTPAQFDALIRGLKPGA